MFRIVADQKTLMDLTHRCGTIKGCDGCILQPFCEEEQCVFHETSFVYESSDESVFLATQLNPDPKPKSTSNDVELLFGGQ
jgi:hypothetical protein